MKKNHEFGHYTNNVWTKTVRVMKLTTILIFLAIFSVAAEGFSQGGAISVKMENASLKEVFQVLKSNSDYTFVYSEVMVEDIEIESLDLRSASFEEVLNQSLEGTDLEYYLEGTVVVIRKKDPVIKQPVQQEKKIIQGKVIDKNGIALPGVSVVIKGTSNGTATNVDGEYFLELKSSNQTLVYSFVGMVSREAVYTGQAIINITLSPDAEQMEEVVIIGYGSVKKKDLTGSVSRVSKEVLENAPVSATIQSVLQGRAAGVNVNIQSASPTSPISVIIRGASSLSGDNQPLWVIDGVVQYGNSASGDISSSLYNLNLNDVQSVDVLKDASATAIYGSRGANGVVIVTTRKGVEGMKPQIEFSSKYSFQTIDDSKVKVMKADEWINFSKEAVREGIVTTGDLDFLTRQFIDEEKFYAKFANTSHFTKDQITDDLFREGGYLDGDTDWWDLMTRNSLKKQFNLSIRGGSKNSSYYASLTAEDNKGIVKGSDRENYSLRFNFESNVQEKIKMGLNLSSSYGVANVNDVGISNVLDFRPDYPAFDEDGNYFFVDRIIANPMWGLESTNETVTKRMDPSMYLEYDILDGLKLKLAGGVAYGLANMDDFRVAGQGNKTSRKLSTKETTSLNVESTLNYFKSFKKHDVNVLLGTSRERHVQEGFGVRGIGFPDDKILIDLGSASEYDAENINSHKTANSLVSFFARANYIYDKRYYATATIRRDGSSRFGSGKRWGVFPSAALAWTISEEGFIKDNMSQLNYLKLRVSAGKTGSQNLGNYDSYALMKSVVYNGTAGTAVDNLSNPNLQWESQMQYDIGVDFGLFEDRLRGTIGWYQKDVDNLLYLDPVSLSSSKTTVIQNIGAIRNKGFEFDIRYDIIKKEDMKLELDFNVAFNKGTLEKLNSADPYFGGGFRDNFRVNVGGRFGDFYGYKYGGRLFQTMEEILALRHRDERGIAQPYRDYYESIGDLYILDVDGNKQIADYSTDDFVNLGSSIPKAFGGFGATFVWKGFYVNTTFTYSVGGKRYWQNEADMSNLGNNNLSTRAFKSWTVAGNGAELPRTTYYGLGKNTLFNEKYIHDSSYLRLSALNIAYKLPETIFAKSLISTIELSAHASNLFTISKYPGFDPQGNFDTKGSVFSGMGIDHSTYPAAKTVSLGIKVLFK